MFRATMDPSSGETAVCCDTWHLLFCVDDCQLCKVHPAYQTVIHAVWLSLHTNHPYSVTVPAYQVTPCIPDSHPCSMTVPAYQSTPCITVIHIVWLSVHTRQSSMQYDCPCIPVIHTVWLSLHTGVHLAYKTVIHAVWLSLHTRVHSAYQSSIQCDCPCIPGYTLHTRQSSMQCDCPCIPDSHPCSVTVPAYQTVINTE